MNAFEFNLNDELLIELANDECFSGELVFRNKTGTKIELANVRNISANMIVEGTQIFYCTEIINTTRLGSIDDKTESNPPKPSVLPSTRSEPIRSTHMPPDQFKRIITGIDDAILIDRMGSKYREAMQLLRKTDSFAVSISANVRASASVISLISICTEDLRIIQLDIMSMGRVPTELKILLEARVPRKVMHNSPIAAYILESKCDVKLNGIFDTLLAHVAAKGDKSIVSVTECVGHHLKIPAAVFLPDHDIDWTIRPLSTTNQRAAAQRAAFLPALQMYLLHERFLADFYQQCKDFTSCYRTFSDEADINFQIGSQSNTNIHLLKHAPIVKFDAVPRDTMNDLVRNTND